MHYPETTDHIIGAVSSISATEYIRYDNTANKSTCT